MSIEWAKHAATKLLVIRMSRPFAARIGLYGVTLLYQTKFWKGFALSNSNNRICKSSTNLIYGSFYSPRSPFWAFPTLSLFFCLAEVFLRIMIVTKTNSRKYNCTKTKTYGKHLHRTGSFFQNNLSILFASFYKKEDCLFGRWLTPVIIKKETLTFGYSFHL